MAQILFHDGSPLALRASITPVDGARRHLLVTRFDRRDRRTEERVRVSAVLSRAELRALRQLIDEALAQEPAAP